MFNVKLNDRTIRTNRCLCRTLQTRQGIWRRHLFALIYKKVQQWLTHSGWGEDEERDKLNLNRAVFTISDQPARADVCIHSRQAVHLVPTVWSCQLPVHTWHREGLGITPATFNSEESMHCSRWRCTMWMYFSLSILVWFSWYQRVV